MSSVERLDDSLFNDLSTSTSVSFHTHHLGDLGANRRMASNGTGQTNTNASLTALLQAYNLPERQININEYANGAEQRPAGAAF